MHQLKVTPFSAQLTVIDSITCLQNNSSSRNQRGVSRDYLRTPPIPQYGCFWAHKYFVFINFANELGKYIHPIVYFVRFFYYRKSNHLLQQQILSHQWAGRQHICPILRSIHSPSAPWLHDSTINTLDCSGRQQKLNS